MKISLFIQYALWVISVGALYAVLGVIFGQDPIGIDSILIIAFAATWAYNEDKKAT